MKCPDVLDVWFESGCSHLHVLAARHGAERADLCLEGSDQHRGWFQSSLLVAAALDRPAPYRAVRSHGFVLDAKGRKMSKSLGNVLPPNDAAARFGADALRLWALSSDHEKDVRVFDGVLAQRAEDLRKLRNTLRWALGNLSAADWSPVDPEALEEPERWVLARARACEERLLAHARGLDMRSWLSDVLAFAAGDLSAVWFDMRKDALYCDAPGSVRRRGVATVLREVTMRLCLWASPVAPLAADEAWTALGMPGHVHDAVLPPWDDRPDPGLLERWDLALSVREAAKSAVAAAPRGAPSPSDTLLDVRAPAPFLARLPAAHLAALCGVAAVALSEGPDLSVGCRPAPGARCPRCRTTVERLAPGADVCGRCAEA